MREANLGKEKNEDISAVRASNSAVSVSRDGGFKDSCGSEDIVRTVGYSADSLKIDRADCRVVGMVYVCRQQFFSSGCDYAERAKPDGKSNDHL